MLDTFERTCWSLGSCLELTPSHRELTLKNDASIKMLYSFQTYYAVVKVRPDIKTMH